jgi:hypothetical protein
MKIPPNGPENEELDKLNKQYLYKKVVLKYAYDGGIKEKEGMVEQFASSVISLRTSEREVISLPYSLKIEIEEAEKPGSLEDISG